MVRYFGVFASHHHLRPRVVPGHDAELPGQQLPLDLTDCDEPRDPSESKAPRRIGRATRSTSCGLMTLPDSTAQGFVPFVTLRRSPSSPRPCDVRRCGHMPEPYRAQAPRARRRDALQATRTPIVCAPIAQPLLSSPGPAPIA